MLSDDRAQKALVYLAETDELCAEAKANAERMEFKAKAIRQAIFLHSEGTVAERTAIAETHQDYAAAMEEYFVAIRQYAHTMNKRDTEKIVMDTWRTICANRRRGE